MISPARKANSPMTLAEREVRRRLAVLAHAQAALNVSKTRRFCAISRTAEGYATVLLPRKSGRILTLAGGAIFGAGHVHRVVFWGSGSPRAGDRPPPAAGSSPGRRGRRAGRGPGVSCLSIWGYYGRMSFRTLPVLFAEALDRGPMTAIVQTSEREGRTPARVKATQGPGTRWTDESSNNSG